MLLTYLNFFFLSDDDEDTIIKTFQTKIANYSDQVQASIAHLRKCRQCKSENWCTQGLIKIGNGNFSPDIALYKFFDQLDQALRIARSEEFRFKGQSEENKQEIQDYELHMNMALKKHEESFLNREYAKLKRKEISKFGESFDKSVKENFKKSRGKFVLPKHPIKTSKHVTFNEDIKPEKHSSSSTTSTTLPRSSSTKSSTKRSSSTKCEGTSDHPIELNLDSSSESSESSELSARFDEDEVEDNFEMPQDDPVEVAHVGVAAAADRAFISDNEEHVDTSKVALKKKKKGPSSNAKDLGRGRP